MTERIYIDIDGVLADLAGEVCRRLSLDESTITKHDGGFEQAFMAANPGTSKSAASRAVWGSIAAGGWGFWANLPECDECFELIAACNDLAPTYFLTSPAGGMSAHGKLEWLSRRKKQLRIAYGKDDGGHKYRKPPHRRFILCAEKEALAGPGRLLIDDSPENCKAWDAAGGRSILWPRPWNDSIREASASTPRLDGEHKVLWSFPTREYAIDQIRLSAMMRDF